MGEACSSNARSTGYDTNGTPKIWCSILARAEYMRVPLPAARIKQARSFFTFNWPRLTRILRGLVYHRTPKGASAISWARGRGRGRGRNDPFGCGRQDALCLPLSPPGSRPQFAV